ncbi:MAG: hypothetical protein QW469_01195 [Candidatus Aenigmatarchaeota archaeon]
MAFNEKDKRNISAISTLLGGLSLLGFNILTALGTYAAIATTVVGILVLITGYWIWKGEI